MTEDWTLPAWLAVLVLSALLLVAVVGVIALVRLRRQTTHDLERVRSELGSLRHLLDELERGQAEPGPVVREDGEFVITSLAAQESADQSGDPEAPPAVDARLFGDLVLREAVVQAASWAHGVRRALTPESRNRIRFEIRREVKRSRKQRRADLRQARREWEDRQRAGVDLADPEPEVSHGAEDSAA